MEPTQKRIHGGRGHLPIPDQGRSYAHTVATPPVVFPPPPFLSPPTLAPASHSSNFPILRPLLTNRSPSLMESFRVTGGRRASPVRSGNRGYTLLNFVRNSIAIFATTEWLLISTPTQLARLNDVHQTVI